MIKHLKTGITVKCEKERDQRRNKKLALSILKEKLKKFYNSCIKQKRSSKRREQIGTGLRSEKIRTIQVHRDRVVNHSNNKKMSFKKYSKGYISEIY